MSFAVKQRDPHVPHQKHFIKKSKVKQGSSLRQVAVLVHLADEEQSCVVDGRRGGGECRSVVSRVADSQASRVASVAVMRSSVAGG